MADLLAEPVWLERVRSALLRADPAAAESMLGEALNNFPQSVELRRIRAHMLQRAGQDVEAVALFRVLLEADPGDVAAAFALARVLIERGQTAAAVRVVSSCVATDTNREDVDLVISTVELLDDAGRKAAAAEIAAIALDAQPRDARLHAYAGMLRVQLGDFDRARQHYLHALEYDARAWEWHVPLGLSAASHYASHAHPDFALFEAGLERIVLSDLARAELHFALGKANDDVGNYAAAAAHFKHGNAIGHRLSEWSQSAWHQVVDARLGRTPVDSAAAATTDFTPVFIVGMPRTGTTLLATHLARFAAICNRGELPWLARIAQRLDVSAMQDPAALRAAANEYAQRSRQDDAAGARWFIDKQPLNFCFLDVAFGMFPNARVIHCVRGARDTALSLWMQCFLHAAHGYSYTFDDIAMAMRDERQLMAQWTSNHADAIRVVRYEDFVADPQTVLDGVAAWLGVAAAPVDTRAHLPASSISTASVWQARQAVHMHSVGRWRHYADLIPELLQFSE